MILVINHNKPPHTQSKILFLQRELNCGGNSSKLSQNPWFTTNQVQRAAHILAAVNKFVAFSPCMIID